jgi:hypothetical protein
VSALVQMAGVLIVCATLALPCSALDLEPKVLGVNSVSGGFASEVVVSGNYAYVIAREFGLQVYDISNPARPRPVSGYRSAGYAAHVAITGNYAYLSSQRRFNFGVIEGGGLDVIDISDPLNPRRVGGYTGQDSRAIAAFGLYAYVAERSGFRIVNVSNPTDPRIVGNIPIDASAVAVSGDNAYLVQLNQGFQVFDISNPQHPELVGDYAANGIFQDIIVSGGYAYLADQSAGVHILNISDPAYPQFVGMYLSSARKLAISGNHALVAAQPRLIGTNNVPGGLHIVNINDPANARLVGRYDGIEVVQGVAPFGNYACVVDGEALTVIDLADSATPGRVGGYFVQRDTRDVAVSGQYAHLADGVAGLEIFDVSNPANPDRVGGLNIGPARSVAVAGNHAFVISTGALHIVDIANPGDAQRLAQYEIEDEAMNLTVSGSFAYVAARSWTNRPGGGLYVIDIGNPAIPRLEGRYVLSNAVDVAVAGNYAYLIGEANRDGLSVSVPGFLDVLDISNPANPNRVARYLADEHTQSVALSGHFAYVADGLAGLHVVGISDPANPKRVGGYGPTSYPVRAATLGYYTSAFTSVTVSNNQAYVAELFLHYDHGFSVVGSSVQILDVTNPTDPRRIGSSHVGEYDNDAMFAGYVRGSHAQGMVPAGNNLFVAGGEAGLQVINISNPAIAQVLAQFHPGGYGPAITVVGDYAYVAEQRRFTGSNWIGGDFQIIDVNNPANPAQVSNYPVGEARDVAVLGTNACVVTGSFLVLDISDRANPKLAGEYRAGALIRVALSGDYAYVVGKPFNGRGGLHVIDLRDPSNPQRVGGYDSGGEAFDITLAGNYAYVAQGPRQTTSNYVSGGLQMIDINNPTNPQPVGVYSVSGSVHDVTVSGPRAYLVGPEIGLHVLDITNPANPRRIGAYESIEAESVAVSGNFAYVVDTETRLHVVDITDPARPSRVGGNTSFTGFYDTSPSSVTVAGGKVYVGAADKGLFVLHAYQPIRFQQVSRLPNGINLRISGPPELPGRVQRSADLLNWADWLPVRFGEEPVDVIDRDSATAQFYRLAVP